MSKSKPAGPTVAGLLTQLEALLPAPPSADRGRAAWGLVAAGVGLADFPAVLDFAQENDLVAGFEPAPGEPNPTWANPADGSEMVWVPPGRFLAGANDTPAECGGFSLAKHPVTNRQFLAFLTATNYWPADAAAVEPEGDDSPGNGGLVQHWPDPRTPPPGKGDHPVVFVSYRDAVAYCRWAGLSLPGEFLWEKAARGPAGRPFPWGDERWQVRKLANVGTADTVPVTRFGHVRSPYGCANLIGNVSEWCQPGDPKHPGAFPPAAPAGQSGTAVVRGSAFLREAPGRMAASHRRRLGVGRRNGWVGFRPAALLPCRPAV